MYDLHNLGWHSFQQLCLTICREVLGQTVESFLPTADAGPDGAFSGVWKSQSKERLAGRFVIQCKFTSKRDSNLRAADLADEIKKAANVGKRGLCDTYLLMTNAGVSGAAAAEITAALKGNGVKHAAIFGSTWICDQIQEHKRLRMMVPRIYGLGDLSQILDDRAYRQARALLASLRDDLSKVVITAAYRRAAEALVSKKYLDNQRSRRFFKDSFRKRAMDRRQRAPDFIETDVIVRGVRPLVGRNQ